MSFVGNIVNDFIGQSSERQLPPPPQVHWPWRAIWDQNANRYVFENSQTGQRSWEYPQNDAGHGGGGYGGGYGERGAGGSSYYQQNTEIIENQGPRRQQHHYGEMALAGAAGLAGGAILMHEGEKLHDRYDYDKYRVENSIENFPDNAARWTGQEVQKVEDIPQDVSGWVGRKVGGVERFGDNIENSYDYGRDEQRYKDDRYAYGGDDYRRDDDYRQDTYQQETYQSDTYERDDYRRDDYQDDDRDDYRDDYRDDRRDDYTETTTTTTYTDSRW